MFDRARKAARRSLQRLIDEPRASDQAPTEPSNDALGQLALRVDRMAESFEAFRQRFESDHLSRQQMATLETRLSEARLLDQLSRTFARASGELLDGHGTLRPPRIPSDWSERPTMSPTLSPHSGGASDSPPGPVVRGLLDDVSLSTLLGLFELERRDGVFRLSAPEGSVELDLRRGAIVRGRVDGEQVDVVAALGRAFDFRSAEFRFSNVAVTADSDAPRSLNGLLLEVLHRQDEARRTG
jgi:hypothetical protein